MITPFDGQIENVMYEIGELVEEGAPLFSLNVNGVTYFILSPISGYPASQEVEQGDTVIAGMILAAIQAKKEHG